METSTEHRNTMSDGGATSQRPSATFCWLPPESSRTGVSRDAVFTASASTRRAASRRSAARSRNPFRDTRASEASVRLANTGRSSTTPWRRRSSGR